MPHSTRGSSQTRVQSFKFPAENRTTLRTSMEKFPDHVESLDGSYSTSPEPTIANGYTASPVSADRWQPRRESNLKGSGSSWTNGSASTGGRHGRQKSLSEAFRAIRTRRASVSANVHEIGDALKAPVSPMLIVCNSFRSPNANADVCCRPFVLYGTLQVLSQTPPPKPS
jgi:solute carrier family 35 protein E1